MTPIIQLKDVSKYYTQLGNQQIVLEDINLEIFTGEFLTIIG
jgi:ABC-type lipoprotein export system ATPase subunit